MPPGIPTEAAQAARETLGGAVAAAAQLPGSLGAALLDTSRAAFMQELQLIAIIGTVGLVAAAVLAFVVLEHVRTNAEREELEPAAESPRALGQPEIQVGD